MPESIPSISAEAKPRVRFAPSPTGFLHVGSARTFIFNWLYARHNGGTMILRLDDTDVERNTQASVDSIFEGLKWLNLKAGTKSTSSRSALNCTARRRGRSSRKALPIATSRRHTPGMPRNPARREPGCSIPARANFRARKVTGAPPRESRLRCVFACRAKAGRWCDLPMRFTASR